MSRQGGAPPPPRLKLVIRRLPPTLPAETFWRVVEPYTSNSPWKRYVQGHPGDQYGKHPVHSRAYVLMPDPQALVALHTGFDGHIFRSKAGVEYQAVVEYAPIEKTPYRAKMKVDARQGTIEEDPDFISFMASLGKVVEKPVLEVSAPISQPTSTPIIDALRASAAKGKAKSAKKKEKEKVKKEEKKEKGKAEKAAGAGASAGTIRNAGVKAAALAAVNNAASKRAPQDVGPVMVAGKGRGVFVTEEAAGPSDPKAAAAAEKRKERKRKQKEKRAEVKEEGSGDPVREETSADSKRGGKRGRGRGRGGGGAVGDRPEAEGGDGAAMRGKPPTRGRGAPRGRGRGGGLAASEARIDM